MTSMTFGDFDFLEIIMLYLYQKIGIPNESTPPEFSKS